MARLRYQKRKDVAEPGLAGDGYYRRSRRDRRLSEGGGDPLRESYKKGDTSYDDYKERHAGYKLGIRDLTASQVANLGKQALIKEHEDTERRTRATRDAIRDRIANFDLTRGLPERVEKTFDIAEGVQARNRSRYGFDLTQAEQQQLSANTQRGRASALAGSLTNARMLGKDLKESMQLGMYDIALQDYLGDKAAVASGGRDAYYQKAQFEADKANWKANAYQSAFSILGDIASVWGS